MTETSAIQSYDNSNTVSLPNPSISSSFSNYVREIQKFPILTPSEEYDYGIKLFYHNDKEAAKHLIQSHLRLVVKIASKFRYYGLPMIDLVSEGNLGLIQAVKKFDPTKGFRLSTYAMWWIRAFIQEYILKSWSLVKIGTTIAQKKLFFNLHKIKKRILDASDCHLDNDQINQISNFLNISHEEVKEMDSRLTQSDTSLNNLISINNESEKELSDFIICQEPSQEDMVIDNQEKSRQKRLFIEAFNKLNDREKDIITKRQMQEKALTLEELSQIYKVSRERIRQIEENAINKIKNEVRKIAKSSN